MDTSAIVVQLLCCSSVFSFELGGFLLLIKPSTILVKFFMLQVESNCGRMIHVATSFVGGCAVQVVGCSVAQLLYSNMI